MTGNILARSFFTQTQSQLIHQRKQTLHCWGCSIFHLPYTNRPLYMQGYLTYTSSFVYIQNWYIYTSLTQLFLVVLDSLSSVQEPDRDCPTSIHLLLARGSLEVELGLYSK